MIDITSWQNGQTSSISAYHKRHSKTGRHPRNFFQTMLEYPSSLVLYNGHYVDQEEQRINHKYA
jgi:hypothetical protein